jgi:hypothetical protein
MTSTSPSNIPDEAVEAALTERLRRPEVVLPIWLDNDEIQESRAVAGWRAQVFARLSEEMCK